MTIDGTRMTCEPLHWNDQLASAASDGLPRRARGDRVAQPDHAVRIARPT
jgi:hypothetical protein